MSSTSITEETEKYPKSIQKLFRPSLPLPYYEPSDYPPQYRKTRSITALSKYKSKLQKYLDDELPKLKESLPKIEKTQFQKQVENGIRKREENLRSFETQLKDWNNPELIIEQEKKMLKDPYKTVFIARLSYSLTEVDITPHFAKYGPIESIKIVRDIKSNKSKGYGFVVFEKDTDAQNCIKELAPTGLKISPEYRTILVDIERSRIVRNWLPRRLGGGLGGRHYTKPNVNTKLSNNSSAAASGRRINLAPNPYQYRYKSSSPSFTPPSYNNTQQQAFTSNPDYNRRNNNPSISNTSSNSNASLREKYDKYSKYSSTSSSQRSSKSIRQRD